MSSGKPTETLEWVATGRLDDPAGVRTDGYNVGDLIPSFQHNWILKNVTEWQQFLDRLMGKTYYVASTTGLDTNAGSETYPFQTIKKAVDSIEAGGYGTVVLDEIGDYPITEDIDNLKNVLIVEGSGITAKIIHTTYINGSDENSIYRFNHIRGGSISFYVDEIEIEAPTDALKAWSDFATCNLVTGGKSFVSVRCFNDVNFSSTSAGSGNPSFVKTWLDDSGTGMPFLSVGQGTINTFDEGYAVDSAGQLAFVTAGTGGIDNVLFGDKSPISARNQIISTGAIGDFTGSWTFAISAGSNLAERLTVPIAVDELDVNIKSTIEDLLNYNLVGSGLEVNVTTTRVGGGSTGNLTSLTLEIAGTFAGQRLYSPVHVRAHVEAIMVETQAPKPSGWNIISNIL